MSETLWHELAELGNAEAQYNLGVMYFYGNGVEQDYALAFKWFKESAEKGCPNSMCNLGLMYEKGCFVEQDYDMARQLYEKAAAKNFAFALFSLGRMAYCGVGQAQDLNEAVRLYTAAAELNHAEAQYNLGVIYASGELGSVNIPQALTWYTAAAEQGHLNAQVNLAQMFEQLQDYEQAVYWYTSAANQDDVDSYFNLGVFFTNGQGIAQSYANAFKCFEKASQLEHALATYCLGCMYERGQGVQRDYAKAHECFAEALSKGIDDAYNYELYMCYLQVAPGDRAQALSKLTSQAQAGDLTAALILGFIYEADLAETEPTLKSNTYIAEPLVTPNAQEALYWYKQAGTAMPDALYYAGKLHYFGVGLEVDYAAAFELFLNAAQSGFGEARLMVAKMYEQGQGVPCDLEQAVFWYNLAASQGLPEATNALARLTSALSST